ncbi:MAG: hypothetical protein HXS46_18830 [Theionarchaea archaeon]|nr:hypothetical protein [Theionarchaea archaeon]
MNLSLVPVGPIDQNLFESLKEYLESIGFQVAIAKRISIPQEAYSKKRNQYLVFPFIGMVDHLKGHHLLITDVDLYTPRLNFIFGYGPGPNAIISIARLKGDLLKERTIKEAVHELGHVFQLRHCSNARCVMYFSNCLADTDYKQKEFCSKCQKLFSLKLKLEQ